jgi:hypothetical protein
MLITVLTFFISLAYVIFGIDQKERKKALKYLILSVISFIIGFGTCLANLNLGGMH